MNTFNYVNFIYTQLFRSVHLFRFTGLNSKGTISVAICKLRLSRSSPDCSVICPSHLVYYYCQNHYQIRRNLQFYYVHAPYIRTKFLCSNPNGTIWKQKFEGISPQQILILSSNLLGYPNKTFFQYIDYNKIIIIVL